MAVISEETLAKIGLLILDGLSEEEACFMHGIGKERLQSLHKTNPGFVRFIRKKQIEFKHNHLKALKSSTDPKLSQWILERLRPQEFSARANRQDDSTVNVVAQIINQVQEHDRNIILSPTADENPPRTLGTKEHSIPANVDEVLN